MSPLVLPQKSTIIGSVQAGSNFVTANNEVAPKQRGLMLKRGQALYVAASGATALTNGFYCNIQGGFY